MIYFIIIDKNRYKMKKKYFLKSPMPISQLFFYLLFFSLMSSVMKLKTLVLIITMNTRLHDDNLINKYMMIFTLVCN